MLSLPVLAQVEATEQVVRVNFKPLVNGQGFECGRSYDGVGTPALKVTPSDFRLYISEVSLMDAEGRAVPLRLDQDQRWQFENIALLDFENATGPCRNGTAAMNTWITGRLPKGIYKGLRFTMGLPFSRNHGDPTTAPAPLSNTAMFWSWQGGYKFLKIDFSNPGYAVHLGSTLCAGASRTQPPESCGNSNRVAIELADFDPGNNQVLVDIGRLLAHSDLSSNAPGTSPGCMSFLKDPDCPKIMQNLGLSYEEYRAKPQVLFAME
jgi:uncharacterized repeat protein (TIGR04052 family)